MHDIFEKNFDRTANSNIKEQKLNISQQK